MTATPRASTSATLSRCPNADTSPPLSLQWQRGCTPFCLGALNDPGARQDTPLDMTLTLKKEGKKGPEEVGEIVVGFSFALIDQ
jgi:hypothetical protein